MCDEDAYANRNRPRPPAHLFTRACPRVPTVS